jgi:hypothetical protein
MMQEHASLQNSSTENTLPPISTNSPRKSDTGQLPPAAPQLIAVTKRSSFLKNEPNFGVKIRGRKLGLSPPRFLLAVVSRLQQLPPARCPCTPPPPPISAHHQTVL